MARATTDTNESEEAKKVNLSMWSLGLSVGFFVAVLVLIPLNSFKELIFAQIEQASGLKVNSEYLGIGFPPSLKFKNLSFYLEDGQKIDITELNASPKFLSLIPGQDRAVTLWGEAFGGEFEAEASEGNPQYLKLDLSSIQYRLMNFLPYTKEINFIGNIIADLQFPPQNVKEISGVFNWDLKGITVQEMNLSGFELPALTISKSLLKATATKGIIKIGAGSYLGQQNDPIEIRINGGEINLLRERMDLPLEIRISESLGKSLSVIDMFLSSFKVQGNEGLYRLKLVGAFTSPEPLPWDN